MVTITLHCPHCQCTVFRHHHSGFLHLVTKRSAAIPRAKAIGQEAQRGVHQAIEQLVCDHQTIIFNMVAMAAQVTKS